MVNPEDLLRNRQSDACTGARSYETYTMVTPYVVTTLSDYGVSGRYKTYTPPPSSAGRGSRFKRVMNKAESSDEEHRSEKGREDALKDGTIGDHEKASEVIGVEQLLTHTPSNLEDGLEALRMDNYSANPTSARTPKNPEAPSRPDIEANIDARIQHYPAHMIGKVNNAIEETFMYALDVAVTNFDDEGIESEMYNLV